MARLFYQLVILHVQHQFIKEEVCYYINFWHSTDYPPLLFLPSLFGSRPIERLSAGPPAYGPYNKKSSGKPLCGLSGKELCGKPHVDHAKRIA